MNVCLHASAPEVCSCAAKNQSFFKCILCLSFAYAETLLAIHAAIFPHYLSASIGATASPSQSIDLGLTSPVESYQNTEKKWCSQLPCQVLSTQGIPWRTSRQARLLCPWARHLTGCLHLYVADRWRGQAVYPWWRLSLTEDQQQKLMRC